MSLSVPLLFPLAVLAALASAGPADSAGGGPRASGATPGESSARPAPSAPRRAARRLVPVTPLAESAPDVWALMSDVQRASTIKLERLGFPLDLSTVPSPPSGPLPVEVVTPYSGPGSIVRVRVQTPPVESQDTAIVGWRFSTDALGPSSLWNGYPGTAFAACALIPPAGTSLDAGLDLGIRSSLFWFENFYLTYQPVRPIDQADAPTLHISMRLLQWPLGIPEGIHRFDCTFQRDDGGVSVVEVMVPMPAEASRAAAVPRAASPGR